MTSTETPRDGNLEVFPYRQNLDRAIGILQSCKDLWRDTPLIERIQLLKKVLLGFGNVASEWVRLSCEAKGISADAPVSGEEWLGGPYSIQRHLRLLINSLIELEKHGVPRFPGKPHKDQRGQWRVPVFPTDIYDQLFFRGTKAEIWLDKDANAQDMAANVAHAYQDKSKGGKISLVLSAGNVSSIGPLDAVHKLFVEKNVVLIKTHPVNQYLKPLLEKAFEALISRGFLQIVEGEAAEGSYLCHHPAVADIHITGSDRTHDAIVFGDQVETRKANRNPLLTKPITSELGNVSPVIVVPGPWTEAELAFQAQNLASSLANNAGFNCNATRVILTQHSWAQRPALLEGIRNTFQQIPTRQGYYPGAAQRHQSFLDSHPDMEMIGSQENGRLPWTMITGLDPQQSQDICFQTEAFCSVFAEAPFEADSPLQFLEKAVDFANNTLWGTLNVTLLVHPKSLGDATFKAAFEKAITELRFGTVSINHWAAVGFAMGSTSWGAYPCHDLYDIRSGLGVVHNTYLLEHVEKTVIRGPFKPWPKPAWFVTHHKSHEIGRKLTEFETKPKISRLPGIFWSALRG